MIDLEDEDNEKKERTEEDIAALYRFYSKHLEMPEHKHLLTLFSQVLNANPFTNTFKFLPLFFLSKLNGPFTSILFLLPSRVLLPQQVACNGFTIEDEELSHMGTAVYPE